MAQLSHHEPMRATLPRFLEAADRFFLPDVFRERSANELAYARLGVIGCLVLGLSAIAFIPWQYAHWPILVLAYMWGAGLTCVALPFLLRRREAIRHLGHVVCAQITFYAVVAVVFSSGRAIGILTVLPLIPMLALLMRGGRAVLGWGSATLAILAMGALMTGLDVPPLVSEFRELRRFEFYPIALICVLMVLGVSLLFESLWNRSAHEIAERAQEVLAAREHRYRTLLEHASDGILVLDAGARIRFASPAAERWIGLPPGGYVGRRIRAFAEAAAVAEVVPHWQRALAHPREQIRVELDRSFQPVDDPSLARHFELSIANQLDDSAVRGVVIHVHDVTERVRAQMSYRNLVEQSLQGIAVVREFRVDYANQTLADLFGTTIEHFVGRPVNDLLEDVLHEDRERVVSALDGPAVEPTEPLEFRIRRGDGAVRWLQIRWSDSVWEGMTARQIAYVDITAQKELEASRLREQERLEARIAERTRELEASQQTLRAQERLVTVGTLAAGVAHQINNPVGGILAAAEFAIVAEEDPDGSAVSRRALREIRDQAIRCGRIIRGILQFARAQSSDKWPGRAVDVVRSAVDATRRVAREQRATVLLSIDPDAGLAQLPMSPIELEQVFVNLILNAIQAQATGARVWIDLRVAGRELEIRVEDDGPGIAPADRDRVFDPFFTTRLKYGGTGLGLSVAQAIVEDHGGRMELVATTRTAQGGACFRVVLPCSQDARALEVQPAVSMGT